MAWLPDHLEYTRGAASQAIRVRPERDGRAKIRALMVSGTLPNASPVVTSITHGQIVTGRESDGRCLICDGQSEGPAARDGAMVTLPLVVLETAHD